MAPVVPNQTTFDSCWGERLSLPVGGNIPQSEAFIMLKNVIHQLCQLKFPTPARKPTSVSKYPTQPKRDDGWVFLQRDKTASSPPHDSSQSDVNTQEYYQDIDYLNSESGGVDPSESQQNTLPKPQPTSPQESLSNSCPKPNQERSEPAGEEQNELLSLIQGDWDRISGLNDILAGLESEERRPQKEGPQL
ncbi:hypothetical protein FRC11_014438 [Ceratobasidium sp. 423]|nr:hypothetical protein FRC11_014438 [Ceratobasidium sp. 423]